MIKKGKKLPENKKLPEKEKRYDEAVGRRKTSVARVRLFGNGGGITINNRQYKEYFPTEEMQKIVEDALRNAALFSKISASVVVKGGGIHSQAEATRHGIARALIKGKSELREKLKRAGFLKRDARVKERRKFGLKKARRAPQWSKR